MRRHIISMAAGFFILVILLMAGANALVIKDVSVSPGEIAPGERGRIIFDIKNNLEESATNVNVKLDLTGNVPIVPYQSSSEDSIEEIENDDKESVSFNIVDLPEAKAGIYKIPIIIQYDYNNTRQTKTSFISITINSPPELELSIESGMLIKNRENKINIRLINSGLSEVKFVYLELEKTAGVQILGSAREYLGDIDSDDFDSMEFRIFVEEDSPSKIQLPVKLSFKDATNKEFSEEKTLSLKVYSEKEAVKLGLIRGPNYALYAGASIVLILLIVWRLKKRKKNKNSRR